MQLALMAAAGDEDPCLQSPPCKALLSVVMEQGFDSRVGLLCCSPVLLQEQQRSPTRLCLVVSLKLVSLLASVYRDPGCAARSARVLRKDEGVRALGLWSFPQDRTDEKCGLAREVLPLSPWVKKPSMPADVRDDVLLLDARRVVAAWKRQKINSAAAPAMGEEEQLRMLRTVVSRAGRCALGPGKPCTYLSSPPALRGTALGRALSWAQVDEAALSAFVLEATGKVRKRKEHVGLGWSPCGARMRSLEEVMYDEEQNYTVGHVELLSGRAVSFPHVEISQSAVFSSLSSLCFPSEEDVARSPALVTEWVQQHEEQARLLLLTCGRELCGPGAEEAARARAAVSADASRARREAEERSRSPPEESAASTRPSGSGKP